METKSYLELFFNDTCNPCYFAEIETHDLAFINKVMEKKIRTYDDVVGKKCYKVLHNRDTPCNFCPMENLKQSQFVEQRIFNEVTRNYHRANSTVITVNEKDLCACKYFVAFQQEREKKIPYDQAIASCMEIINQHDISEAILLLLAILGDVYRCSKVFIYELESSTLSFNTKVHWMKKEGDRGFPTFADLDQVQKMLQWLDHMEGEVTEISSATTYAAGSMEEYMLEQLKVKSATFIPIKSRIGKISGFLGLANRKGRTFDQRLFKTIGRLVEDKNSTDIVANELKNASQMDEQTGFFNRKRYIEFLAELDDLVPNSLGVMFVHMTDLRAVNEKQGFAEGDELIFKTVQFLKSHFNEPFFRITGEEFICFVLNCQEGDFFQRVTKVEEDLRLGTGPKLQIGCAWDTEADKDKDKNERINILELVSEADGNTTKN